MKISVAIPNYNSGKYLARSLDSIFNQSYPYYEVVIADGGSTDNSLDVIREYQKKYPNLYLCSTRTKTEVEHINVGLELTRGDIIAWLCADDTYDPNCFRHVSDRFRDPSIQWVYGRTKIIDDSGAEVRQAITRLKELLQPRYSYAALRIIPFIAMPAVFMRRSFYQQIGRYDESILIAADYDYWLKAGRLSRPSFIDHQMGCWRAHSGSTSVNKYKEQMRQVYEAQKRHPGWWLRPAQWAEWRLSVWLYDRIREKETANGEKQGSGKEPGY